MATLNIIDVAKYQGTIDWEKAAKKIDGVIIRVGYRGYGESGSIVLDPQFNNNIKGAVAQKTKIGVYFFSQATTGEEAEEEAAYVIKRINPYKDNITLPVYFDSEYGNSSHTGRADGLSKETRTAVALRFMNAIKKAGYIPGIYSSTNWFASQLDDDQLKNYTHWIADYRSTCQYKGTIDAWQYTDKATVDGIDGKVDMSHFYKDFGTTKKTTTTTTTTKTTTDTTKKTTTTTTTTATAIDVTYQVYANGKWLPAVKNLEDFAGIKGKAITGVCMKSSKGTLKYRVHLSGNNGWLSWISKFNPSNWNTGCAGLRKTPINAIQIQLTGIAGYEAKYRVKMVGSNDYLPWVVGTADYAGLMNTKSQIDCIQVQIIKK